MPMAWPGAISQTTLPSPGSPVPEAPQQSLVLRQRSPFTWQPLAGWQIFTPVVADGAQSRLQQPLHASHAVPSTPSLQYVDPDGGGAHFPSVAPDAMSQMPPQQSMELEHTSPVWMHQPGVSAQLPLLQYFEQHSELAPQALPAVLHDVLMG
jgi:hypothetical protein